MLNPFCARVLDVLENAPASREVLTKLLHDFLPDAQGQEISSLLEEIVDTLSRIGAIETVEDAL